MVECCTSVRCADNIDDINVDIEKYLRASDINTLALNSALCINCGMCIAVCPQGVFTEGDESIKITKPDACMECGACQINCPVDALIVDSGVGCATAMIYAALTGKPEASCGGPEPDSCCC